MTVVFNLATALCGLGECGEQTTLGFCRLLEKGSPAKIRWVIIQGKKQQSYKHCIILMSPEDVSFKSIREFKSFSDDCILIDPLFGIVGKANEIHSLLKCIIDELGLDGIFSNCLFTSEANQKLALYFLEEAKKISEQVNKKLDLPKRIEVIWVPFCHLSFCNSYLWQF